MPMKMPRWITTIYHDADTNQTDVVDTINQLVGAVNQLIDIVAQLREAKE